VATIEFIVDVVEQHAVSAQSEELIVRRAGVFVLFLKHGELRLLHLVFGAPR
jgi:hypothetical protein